MSGLQIISENRRFELLQQTPGAVFLVNAVQGCNLVPAKARNEGPVD